MFSRKKIAAVSALLGGLAVTCAGANQAYAGGTSGNCTRDITGNVNCLQKNTSYITEDGKYTVKQAQNCASMRPASWPAEGVLNTGSTHIGPAMNCSNTAPAPEENAEPAPAPEPNAPTAPAPSAPPAPAPLA
ncbi:hypothetical protein ACWC2K_10530 [Streptomyces chattanoogensis]|uniref:hypothetical protein n=1 Tax=Streptomyces chattanoogensis TaxID=66876 RepID=UPI0036C99920